MNRTDNRALPEPQGLTYEQEESERQWAARAVAGMSSQDLRLARARLADFLKQDPPEPVASVIRLRGNMAHVEITRRESGVGFFGVLKLIFSRGNCSFAKYTTIPGWNSKQAR